ncbi:MAG: hypothetical protein ABSH46_21000 [Bryobacteraceae bacterium]|jgi:hypothetical protein
MASDRQTKANRENARRSTGPRTPLGKARASLNAVRHGLSARNAVLPQEDSEAYLELLTSLETEFQPHGPLETFLVQQMASAQWRLLRLARMETGFLMTGMADIKEEEEHPRHWSDPDPDRRPPKRRKGTLPEDDEVTRLLGVLFQKSCGHDAFARLTRYENMLNGEYFRALRTLTNLRNTPAPQPAPRNKTNPIQLAAPPPKRRPAIPFPPPNPQPPATDGLPPAG